MRKNTIHDLLTAALMTPDRNGMGVVLAFEGHPGGGKTQSIMAMRELGYPVVVIIGASCDPTDMNGMPAINADGSWSAAAATWVHEINKTGGIVFLDEWTNTAPAVQAAMQRVLSERVLGNVPLHPEVRILAAQNPVSSGGSHQLSPAVLNRICVLPWPGFTALEFAEYLQRVPAWPEQRSVTTAGVHTATPEAIAARRARETAFRAAYEGVFPKVAARVAAFTTTAAGLVGDAQPPKGARAWATRRSVETATRFLAAADVVGLADVQTSAVLAGLVGETWSTAYYQWEATADLPDTYALLRGDTTYVFDPDRVDLAFAVLSNAGAAYTAAQDWGELNMGFLRVVQAACEAGFADVAAKPLAAAAAAARLYRVDDAAAVKLLRAIRSDHIGGLLQAAGLEHL